MLWSCPWREFETTTTGVPVTTDREGTDTVGTFAASITPSYKVDKQVTVFGGLTVRQHPTLDQKGMGTNIDDPEVESGPGNYIVSAGVEGALADGKLLL